jgi:ADP-ribosylglycohydrolase
MVSITCQKRARGCLLGLAIGDALGAPLEGLTPHQIRTHYRQVVDYVDGSRAWRKKPFRWRMPGLYSDDTQQALVLAEVLLDCGRIDPHRVAALYRELATPADDFLGAHRGVGRSFRRVVEALVNGVSPLQTGQDSAGIGAAMRIAPLALFHGEDSDALRQSVMAASLITHRDCRSLAGAFAVVHAVRRLLAGATREPSFALRLAGDVARAEEWMADRYGNVVTGLDRYRHSVSQAIARVESLLELKRADALAALVDEANLHGAEPTCRWATQGFPPACVPTCLYILLTAETFEDALVEVINLGGDADTTGAIAGAMLGATFGADAIPGQWLDGLQNRVGVEARAEALAARSRQGLEIPHLVDTERRLSQRESVLRERLKTQRQNEGDIGANRLH